MTLLSIAISAVALSNIMTVYSLHLLNKRVAQLEEEVGLTNLRIDVLMYTGTQI